MFADDCNNFCTATKVTGQNIRHILDPYCKVSGQFVNLQTSKSNSLKECR